MIPIRLTIQGLYSYQERQTIDFGLLTGAGLFGIFGPVGSGKSTILEAITYALYGDTERLNSRDSRSYNMMNLKSDELFIEFIFRIGKTGEEYMAVARAKRNSRKFDDVKSIGRQAYKRENGAWTPLPDDALPGIIGLSYENFKRTIIIPQGRFQEFLQLGNKDRTQMMKELFNLERFEFSGKVASIESKNDAAIQIISGKMMQLGEVDPETLKSLAGKFARLKDEIALISADIEKNDLINRELTRLKGLFSRLTVQQKKLDALLIRKPYFSESEQKIKEYENCLIHFKGLLDQRNATGERILQLEKQLNTDKKQLTDFTVKATLLETELELVRPEFENREQWKKQAEELKKISRILTISRLISKLTERIENGEMILNQTTSKINELRDLSEKLQESVRELKTQLPDLAELSKVRDWYTVKNNLAKNGAEFSIEASFLQKDVDELKKLVSGFWMKSVFSDVPEGLMPDEIFKILKARIASRKTIIAESDETIGHLMVRSKLKDYAEGLQSGEPCPLCGSVIHPHPLEPEDVAEELKQVKNRKEHIGKEVVALEESTSQLTGLFAKLTLRQEQIARNQGKQEEISIKLSDHLMSFNWPEFPDEESVNAAFNRAGAIGKEISGMEKSISTVKQNLENENKNLHTFAEAIGKFRQEAATLRSESETLAGQLEALHPDDFSTKTDEEIRSLSMELIKKHKETVARFEKIRNELDEAEKIKTSAVSKIETRQVHLKNEADELENINIKIAEQLSLSGYQTAVWVENILSRPIDLVPEKKKLTEFFSDLQLTDSEYNRLKNEIGTAEYNEEFHNELMDALVTQSGILEIRKQESWKTENDIRTIQENLKKQDDLKKELEALELRADDIRVMKKLFAASGLINYISSVYLQNLCRVANDRFYKLTRQKLSLEITEDNNFEVRDFMNGGRVRNVKTLSGGQTFQAALSMALALADNIQKITGSDENFFFLDEGFGSLDRESLDIVFDTLKALRRENRIVGVISHVEEMQQEIGMHLRITNHEEHGSRITNSWSL